MFTARSSIFILIILTLSSVALPQRFVQQSPHSVETYLQSIALFQIGEYQQAEEQIRNLVESNPGFVEAKSLLALICMVLGKRDEGRSIANQALELNPRDPMALVVEGFECLESSNYTQAISVFEKSLVANINQPPIHAALAEAYKRTQNYDKAISSLKRAEALGLRSRSMYSRLGECYSAVGQFVEAADALNRGLIRYPDDTELKKLRAYALYFADSLDQAKVAYQEMLVNSPDDLTLQNGLIQVLIEQEEWHAASKVGYSTDSSNSCASCYAFQRASIAMKIADVKAADLAYRTAYSNVCRLDKYVSCFLLNTAMKPGETTAAEFLYDGILKGDSVYYPLRFLSLDKDFDYRRSASAEWFMEFSGTHNQHWGREERMAAIAAHMSLVNEWDVAEEDWRIACQFDSTNYAMWLNYGCVLHIQKKHEQAEEAYLECLKFDSDNVTALINLLTIYHNRGNRALYLNYYDRLAKVNQQTAMMAAAMLHGKQSN